MTEIQKNKEDHQWTKSRTPNSLPKKVEELLAKSEISLILDTYDDIFSDFDPRPYSKRAISDDFLYAAKKAMPKLKEGALELLFLIPKAQRNLGNETLIKKRLHEHFKKHAALRKKAKQELLKKGAIMTVAGFVILITAGYIIATAGDELFYELMLVVLEPSGWFTVWNGLDIIFFRAHEKDSEMRFYSKMSRAEIIFIEY